MVLHGLDSFYHPSISLLTYSLTFLGRTMLNNEYNNETYFSCLYPVP